MTLFSPSEVLDSSTRPEAGFRLNRLELLNWGTFDRKIWSLALCGKNALLTGDIGSGKSTVVDAITTLLLPANRISYNKASGATSRERDLRSYVRGYYKSERNEATGTSRPIGLRAAGSSYSVILGHFSNSGYGSEVSIAQVFWVKDENAGQPERFFVTSSGKLSIEGNFKDFGSDLLSLKRRLRTQGAKVYDGFPEYSRDFRRSLGIESEQALELLHQTVSMKSVTDLNEFVRNHMLEPWDASAWVTQLVNHFDDLTRAHGAVVKARAQLSQLTPLLAEADSYAKVEEQARSLELQKLLLPEFCNKIRLDLLTTQNASLVHEIAEVESEIEESTRSIRTLYSQKDGLIAERANSGGDRLADLERQRAALAGNLNVRQGKLATFNTLLKRVQMPIMEDRAQFPQMKMRFSESLQRLTTTQGGLQQELADLAGQGRALEDRSKVLNQELLSLQQRRSNIPQQILQIRDTLAKELLLTQDQLPFVGELLKVREDAPEWEGAAERLLCNFGTSLLIPEAHYKAVAQWINARNLRARLVYFRVSVDNRNSLKHLPQQAQSYLFEKLAIKDGSSFYPWLEREIQNRAAHVCVDSVDEFAYFEKAITREGQIKTGTRHEKDDRKILGDRLTYVLGWTNEAKISAVLDVAADIQAELNKLTLRRNITTEKLGSSQTTITTLSTLQTFDNLEELDWWSVSTQLSRIDQQYKQVVASSRDLERIGNEIKEVEHALATGTRTHEIIISRRGGLVSDQKRLKAALALCVEALKETKLSPASSEISQLQARLSSPGATSLSNVELVDKWERQIQTDLDLELSRRRERQRTLGNKVVSLMDKFRTLYPVETTEMDSSLAAVAEYRGLYARLNKDDLPRFEKDFKNYLNTNTIRDIAGFHSALNKQIEITKERLASINASLVGIDYNPGRYIRLEAAATPNVEIRNFKADLRACTDGAVSGAGVDAYSEEKFLQVQKIIERFRGRSGHGDLDRVWTKKVTDVRNWFIFTASERRREDDGEHESYTDTGGKSGGQKEKLAYTILAASLAYQFKLDPYEQKSKTFRFVTIDEAFGRGSDESTRYALSLFERLGLQLLIVTPLQKIHVIEPFVASVGFVDNRSGSYSRIQTLTIEQFRSQQTVRTAARHAALEVE